MSEHRPLKFKLNGAPVEVPDVPDPERLLDLLRWRLGLKGTKEGCRSGDCGACTMLLDGKSTLSCLTLAREAEGREVETVEGWEGRATARQVTDAFARAGAVQCGYCTPGFVMAVEGLLRERGGADPPTAEELAEELGGNLCRCTGYYGVLRALSAIWDEGAKGRGAGEGSPVARSSFQVVSVPNLPPTPPPPPAKSSLRRRRSA